MKKLATFLCILLMSGCAHTHLENIQKATTQESFTLVKDYSRERTAGAFKINWLEGFRACNYSLVAEDKMENIILVKEIA